MKNNAYNIAKPHVVAANQCVQDFLARHGEPDGFDISTDAWLGAEHEINEAIADNDIVQAETSAKAYLARVQVFCEKWEGILKKKERE